MKQLIDSAIKKSKLTSSFYSHFLINADESQKDIYAKLLFECYKSFGKTEKREEFINKIFNTLNIKFDKNSEINEEYFLKIIKNFDFKNYGKSFLIDMFILASLGDFDEYTREIIKNFLKYFNVSPKFIKNIIEIVKYILKDKDWINYSYTADIIITDYYIVDKELHEKDRIFLNCTIEFYENSLLISEKSNFLYFINCNIISPQIKIKESEFVKIVNCEIYEKFAVNSYIEISDVYSLEIKDNRIINLKNPENLMKISKIQYFNASNNKYEIFSEFFDLKL